jgi:rod shape-determining protein MreD
MPTLIAFPLFGLLVVLQSAIISRIHLLQGSADLVMLAVIAWALQRRVTAAWQWSIIGGILANLTTALPLGVPLAGYALSTGLALVIRQRVWRSPILAMFTLTFLGTLITHAVSVVILRITGDPIPLIEAFNLVTLPSVFLNMLMAIPLYAMVSDLADWLYPEELEV